MHIYILRPQIFLLAIKYNCQLPDSILKAVNLPRAYPHSKDCYQNQNTTPDSQVQWTAKPFTNKLQQETCSKEVIQDYQKEKRRGKVMNLQEEYAKFQEIKRMYSLQTSTHFTTRSAERFVSKASTTKMSKITKELQLFVCLSDT